MHTRRSLIPAFLLSCLAAALPAWCQTLTGLTGTVTDNSGGILIGATVTAKNSATGVAYRANTSDSGTYVIQFLPPGPYNVECEHAGFKRAALSGIVLETGFTRTVDIRLEVGLVSDSVSVTATSPLLESENTSVGQLIERITVATMPLESRRGAGLTRLTGGVQYSGEVVGGEGVTIFALAGGRSRNQQWLLDGTTVQNTAMGLPQLAINPPVESLQEFKVEANAFSAEIGRAGGGAIVMTSRSGTNEFHGAAYEFLRNNKMDARSFFARSRAPLRYNVFGASAGGPIVRNKTFFFANFEGARRREGVTYSSDTVPRPSEVAGDFSSRRDVNVRDPLTGQPFAGNRIPASRIDPIGGAVAKFYPTPHSPDDPTRAPRANFINNASNVIDTNYFFGRIDHNLGEKDRLYGRIIYIRTTSVTSAVFPNKFADPRGTESAGSTPSFAVNWIRNLTPSIFNELRFERLNSKGGGPSYSYGSNVNQQLGLKGVDPTYGPIVVATGLTQLGNSQQARFLPKRLTQHVLDSIAWIKGSHTIKAGFEFRFSDFDDESHNSPGGSFSFTDRATGDGLATVLLGWTTSASLADNDVISSRTDYLAGYAQDNWKVTPKLSLNFGLRWEMDTPRWEKNNRQNGVDLRAINPVSGTPGIVTFAGRNGLNKYAHDFDGNNFGPHLGFAWRVAEKMVVRAGYGLNYLGEYGSALPNALAAGFNRSGDFTSSDGGLTPAFPFRDGLPAITRAELGPGFGAVAVGQAPRFAPQFIASNHQNGYSQHWNFSVQREFRAQMLAEVSYLGNVGHKMAGGNVNHNYIPLVNGRGPERQDQRLRQYPQYSGLNELGPDWANSTYHAMNLKLEKRYSGGLNLLMNYTLSKFLDRGFEGNQHPDLRKLDKSLSVSDIPHRLTASTVYQLPVGRGQRLSIQNAALNRVLGGWSVGLIAEIQDGLPFGVNEQTNLTNTFSAGQRSNLVGNPYLATERSRSELLAQYFDTAAFAAPGLGIFGNAPRTFLRGPGVINVDMSVHKRWVFTERYNLQLRGDFFNLPNRPNFGLPNGARGNANFGRITSSAAGRISQVGLRFEF